MKFGLTWNFAPFGKDLERLYVGFQWNCMTEWHLYCVILNDVWFQMCFCVNCLLTQFTIYYPGYGSVMKHKNWKAIILFSVHTYAAA